tara:strand:+ start:2540 stop:3376 length:837 start_codon:yes stop_codon:yes gene_type:complete
MYFKKKKIGIMQGRLSPIYNNKIQSFPKYHWFTEFKKTKKLKLNSIEWTLDHKEILKNPINTKEGKQKILKLKKKYKINITSLTGDCFMQRPFWKETINKRKKLINILKLILENSSKIGIKKIILPLVDNGSIKNENQKKTLISTLKNLTPILKKNKQQILFELNFKPQQALKFIKKFNSTYFGINYDMGNSSSLGFRAKDEINAYGNYIKNVHIKDRYFKGTTVRLGKGDVDFDEVFYNLNKIKYEGNFILQTARSNNGFHKKEINMNLNFLKKWFY